LGGRKEGIQNIFLNEPDRRATDYIEKKKLRPDSTTKTRTQ
jgi:hypothetical protein